jgi:hypothetical protein
VEQPVGDRAGRSHLAGVLVGLADLGQDLGLARHQRVEAAGHLEQVLGRVAASRTYSSGSIALSLRWA